ncbi:VanZ family protein [Lactococcus petauri]|uniref:VanZ family protein n=1 Tax=Lactococcus petauri TaxID=1940789 RepID=UPI0022E86366|nr:VanZ family protein [Lactococcus petauri]
MLTYLHAIQIGVLLFFVFFLLSLIPYMIVQYRKYGRVNPWRFIVNFSFVLYIVCAYAMTIFPLPDVAQVTQMTGPKQNLVPFEFVRQFIAYNPLVLNEPSTWLMALKAPSFIQPFFNLLLTLPFGIYLRYLFKRNFSQTLMWSFMLTLSFELLQRSALFGLYPRPYRLFDVDDLMINTLGSLLGFGIACLLVKVLPDLDAKQAIPAQIGMIRRSIAFGVDFVLANIIANIVPHFYIAMLITFVGIPVIFGVTFGQKLLKIRIEGSRWKILSRQLLSFVNFGMIGLLSYFLQRSAYIPQKELGQNFLMVVLSFILLLLPLLDILFATLSRTRKLWYERLSQTELSAKEI